MLKFSGFSYAAEVSKKLGRFSRLCHQKLSFSAIELNSRQARLLTGELAQISELNARATQKVWQHRPLNSVFFWGGAQKDGLHKARTLCSTWPTA